MRPQYAYVMAMYITWAQVVCLICPPEALGPQYCPEEIAFLLVSVYQSFKYNIVLTCTM